MQILLVHLIHFRKCRFMLYTELGIRNEERKALKNEKEFLERLLQS